MRSAPRNDGADIPNLPMSIIYTWVVVVCARKPLVSMHASYMTSKHARALQQEKEKINF
jgi:hypothetical protein